MPGLVQTFKIFLLFKNLKTLYSYGSVYLLQFPYLSETLKLQETAQSQGKAHAKTHTSGFTVQGTSFPMLSSVALPCFKGGNHLMA